MPHIQRTKFKNQIVAEFSIPENGSDKVIVLAGGMPGYPEKGDLMRFLVKRGYSVFNPRYRGTWESIGEMLAISPHQDILDVIDELPKGFKDAWNGEEYRIEPEEIILIGASFGGPAVLLCASDPRVSKVITISSVVDWTSESREEPLDFLLDFMRNGFVGAYKLSDENWKKLERGDFYNPVSHVTKIDGSKVLMIHAKDDNVVDSGPVEKFAEDIGAKLIMLKKGGHIGMTKALRKWPLSWKVKKFLNS